ncbi:MAG: hypothetical protein IJ446_09975 [Oscillospiraceae bacterium]|nr:hypothetical protein [Oscillospiraceae bacterium]
MDIEKYSDNDSFVISMNYEDMLYITIETWNGRKYRISFSDCPLLMLYGSVPFEIGSITVKNTPDEELVTEGHKEGVSYENYLTVIFYDPWQTDRINMKIVYDKYEITEI